MTTKDCNCGKTPVSRMARGAVKLAKAELGIGLADAQEVADRRIICEGCEHWDHGKCRECGCYTWAKTRLTKERCPVGSW